MAANIDALLRRVSLFLEESDFDKADEYCERILDEEPENAKAYIGKLLVDMRARSLHELSDCPQDFSTNKNFQKAIRFGGDDIAKILDSYLNTNKLREKEEQVENNENKTESKGLVRRIPARVCVSGFLIIVICVIYFAWIKTEENKRYVEAKALLEKGCYEEAYIILAELGKNDEILKNKRDRANTALSWANSDRDAILSAKFEMSDDEFNSQIIRNETEYEYAYGLLRVIDDEETIKSNKYERAISLLNAAAYDRAYELLEEIGKPEVVFESMHKRANDLIDKHEYEKAYDLLRDIGLTDEIEENKYNRAITLLNQGVYGQAYDLLEEIKRYDVIRENRHDLAMGYIDSKQYDKAIELLKKNEERRLAVFYQYEYLLYAIEGEYFDEALQIVQSLNTDVLRTQYDEDRYTRALKFVEEKNYCGAYVLLYGLNYKDNKEILREITPLYREQKLKYVRVGEIITIGKRKSGKDIEWIVLAKEQSKLLLFSVQSVDCQKYHSKNQEVTWSDCDLRRWLNNTFINESFSDAEKRRILKTHTQAIDYYDFKLESTSDKVYILDFKEVEKYREVLRNVTENQIRAWLRSPGPNCTAMVIRNNGEVDKSGLLVNTEYVGVHAVMWISVE